MKKLELLRALHYVPADATEIRVDKSWSQSVGSFDYVSFELDHLRVVRGGWDAKKKQVGPGYNFIKRFPIKEPEDATQPQHQ